MTEVMEAVANEGRLKPEAPGRSVSPRDRLCEDGPHVMPSAIVDQSKERPPSPWWLQLLTSFKLVYFLLLGLVGLTAWLVL